MVWKPKEKELSKEEAIELAKTEVAPYWIGSPPLIVAAPTDAGPRIFPIHPKFDETSWVMHIIDPTTYSGQSQLHYAQLIDSRYARYGLQTLVVLAPRHEFHLQRTNLETFVAAHKLRYPVVTDYSRLLQKAFEVDRVPATLILEKSSVIFRADGTKISAVDQEVQKYLRRKDPGLALHPILEPDAALPLDSGELEFGKGKGCKFEKLKDPPQTILPGKLYAQGNWTQEAEGISTSDKGASVVFQNTSNGLGILALSMGKTIEAAKVFLEINGVPAYDSHLDLDAKHDESGVPYIEVQAPRLYRALHHLTPDLREITLRFPMASRVPVQLVGVRFQNQI